MEYIESAEVLTPEQQEVWDKVSDLWRWLQQRDLSGLKAAIHPLYIGWESGSLLPHDRDFALKSAESDPAILDYRLHRMNVEVYEGVVGVAHYSFDADVTADKGKAEKVRGRWTEVYLKKDGAWLLISVHGGSDK